jgi:hypothetical protein
MKKKSKNTTEIPYTSTTQGIVPALRKFYLLREEDVSGKSGTGIVAVGCMFPSGLCVMEWTTPIKSVGHYHSIAELEALHGHEGRTKVVWLGDF